MPLVALLVVAVCLGAYRFFSRSIHRTRKGRHYASGRTGEQTVQVADAAISMAHRPWTLRPHGDRQRQLFSHGLARWRSGRTHRRDAATARAGGPLPVYHLLSAHGPVDTLCISSRFRRPWRCRSQSMSTARPFSTWLLILLYAALGIAVLGVDTMLWRRGVEPAFAASLLLPLLAAGHFPAQSGFQRAHHSGPNRRGHHRRSRRSDRRRDPRPGGSCAGRQVTV